MTIQPSAEPTIGELPSDADWSPDEFLVVVAHELRNLTGTILGWTDIVSRRPLDAELRTRAIGVIRRNAWLQARLIDRLREFSRITSRDLPLEAARVALAATIDAAVDATVPLARAKSLEIRATLDDAAATISGDPALLEMVLINLLSNAVKFTPPGGRIEVCTRCTAHDAEVTVSDTGQGISGDFLPFVFDRFRRQGAPSDGGLGLGLAIVRYVVEKHGGRIRAASEGEGRGASFTIRLPLAP